MPVVAADGFGTKLGTGGKWTVYAQTDQMSDEKHIREHRKHEKATFAGRHGLNVDTT
jgi:hypothetical protein